MAKGILLLLFVFTQSISLAQDSWKKRIDFAWSIANHDTTRALLLAELSNYHKYIRPDSGLFYGYKALEFARQIKFPKAEVEAMLMIAITQITLGNDAKALQINLQGNKVAEENNMPEERASLLTQLGIIYNRSKNYEKALNSFKESMRLFELVHDLPFFSNAQSNIGETCLLMNQPDSALYYGQLAYNTALQIKDGNNFWVMHIILLNLGNIYNKKGNIDLALSYFRQALQMAMEPDKIIAANFSITQLYEQIDKPDSGIYYAKKSLDMAREGGFYSDATTRERQLPWKT